MFKFFYLFASVYITLINQFKLLTMKKNYVTLLLAFISMFSFSQSIFNNDEDQTGDSNWFTPNNWNTNVVPDASVGFLQINQNVTLNSPVTHKWVRGGNGTVTISGSGSITISDTKTNISGGIQGNSTSFVLDVPVIFDSDQIKNIFLGANNREIIFNSSVTCNTVASVVAAHPSRFVQFNGAQSGPSVLRFMANSGGEFSATSNNSGLLAGLQVSGGCNIVSNSTIPGGFLGNNEGMSKLQVNGDGSSLTLNGADIFQGNLSIGGQAGDNYSFTLNVNENQPNVGSINFADANSTGALNINIAALVDNLSFANSSTFEIPSINITGFESGEIRFGLDNTGLTSAQLSNITADGVATGEALGLDASGYLVLASALSVNDVELEKVERISYPSIVENEIRFSRPQNNFKIYDITGKEILNNELSEVQFIDLSFLKSGLYLIKFDSNKVEKIVKK
jgi:hypothetical protein